MSRVERTVVVMLAGLAVVASAGLVYVASAAGTRTAEIARSGRLVALVEGLEVDLLAYNRMSNMHLLRGEGDPAISRGYLEASLRRRLQAASALAARRPAAPLLAQAEARIGAYLSARREAEEGAGPDSIGTIDRKISPALDAAFASLEGLARHEMTAAEQRAAQARRRGTVEAAVGWSILGLVAVAAGLLGVRAWRRRGRRVGATDDEASPRPEAEPPGSSSSIG